MQGIISPLKNEDGSVIVMAMIILVLLTLIGISSTDNTVIENQIVRSEALYRQNLYRAESAIIELAQFMEDNDITSPAAYDWLTDAVAAADMTIAANWDWSGGGSANAQLSNNMDDAGDANNVTAHAAIAKGIAGGSSLDMAADSNLYDYDVYGIYNSTTNQGRKLIAMGYRKRF
jgi:Tfp pilus assembly protein PilX